MALKVCHNCGRIPVPYPLSTGPDCGGPWYKVRCNEGTLWLDTLNGSSYEISSVNPMTQTLIIVPPGLAKDTCMAADFATQGIQLDENLPFNITSTNTVMLMNWAIQRLMPIVGHCQFAVVKWPKPGMEIQWLLPREPECKLPENCIGLSNSMCLTDPGNARLSRCLCKPGFQWNSIQGICQGAAIAAGAIIIGLIVTIIIVCKQRKHREREAEVSLTNSHRDLLSSNSGKLAKFFTMKEISKATKSFSKGNLLGSGGFGEVFKGILDDGTTIAVKRSKLGNTQGIDQIINEVRILCQVNHRNLVKLLGCCVELQQPLLIYEYIPNGTLFDHLHTTCKMTTLSWHRRLRIAYQAAQGLAYLHSSVVPPIYHRDVKSSNILLDENLDAKVSDLDFELTDKSDVYSFGVVLLELLTSKKAVDFNRKEEDVNLEVFAMKILKAERFMDVIDPCFK
ncbi:Wall-associated receptor kinase-like 15 [Hibiscus syriacus]|uniref:Wall-associated receptor kinase-like 15 n=1 Tax=Hibiscus syriacus TaxID=106335 RepID=A0A6A2X294_HIBSY|nr:Wall-associated receptor kinase-like 15 [Hibiscus syriacus]